MSKQPVEITLPWAAAVPLFKRYLLNYLLGTMRYTVAEAQATIDDSATLENSVIRKAFNAYLEGRMSSKLVGDFGGVEVVVKNITEGARLPQDAKNQASVEKPMPGDKWHEMFCPVWGVIEVLDDGMMVVWDYSMKSPFPDTEQYRVISKEDFMAKIFYRGLSGKLCCDVTNNSKEVVEDVIEWNANLRKEYLETLLQG